MNVLLDECVDRRFRRYIQQNVAMYPIAIVVLRAKSNRVADLAALARELLSQLSAAPRGAVTVIGRPISKD